MEAHHPDIRFDWQQIRDGEGELPPVPAPRPSREPAPQIARSRAAAVNGTFTPDGEAQPLAGAPPAQIGSETVARLRARYSDVMARIAQRIADPARANELKAEAARLNPDTWITAEDMRRGLDQYESRFESIRSILGRRRRRKRSQGSQQSTEHGRAGDASPENSPLDDALSDDSEDEHGPPSKVSPD